MNLHNILEDIKQKGYDLPQTKYKRLPQGFDANDEYSYLSKYDAIFALKAIQLMKLFIMKKS